MVKVSVTTKKRHDTKKGLSEGVQDGLEAYLRILQNQSKQLAPVDTGLLRGSIRSTLKGFIGKVFTLVEYAIYQEEGSRAANGGRGYFKPAVDITRNRIAAIFGKAIRSGIRKN